MGLNYRITDMIAQYRHHVSFYKASILTSDYLYINVLPQIGFHVRSLVIDRNYSCLQDELFIEHFGKKMSMIFPKLERISLTYYEHDTLLIFLDTLHDLNHLNEIRLYDFFDNPTSNQTITVRSLCQANNHRFTTILVDDRSSCLHFDDNDRYLNVLRLRINLTSVIDLPALFATVPNVHYLDVVISEESDYSKLFNEMKFTPLLHLIEFQLKSLKHGWGLEELSVLLVQLPIVQNLLLSLSTFDNRLVEVEDQQTQNLLGQCITSLNIYKNTTERSLITVNEEHLPIIASVFPRVRD
ncbi:unnamed protein product, partial [Rotaria sordida]